MTTPWRRLGSVILALGLSLASSPASGQVRIDPYGISLRVPQDWEQIPSSIVERIERDAGETLGMDIDYVAGFQPEPGEDWLALPYVLFQVEYLGRPVSDQDLLDAVESGLYEDSSERITEQTTDAGVLDAASFGRPVWNPRSRILWTSFEVSSPDRGRFQGLTGQTLFRDGVLMLHYYFSLEQPVAPVMDVAEQTLLATAYDPGREYSESAAVAASRNAILSRVLDRGASGALVGGVFGLLVGIAGWVISRLRGRSESTEETSPRGAE